MTAALDDPFEDFAPEDIFKVEDYLKGLSYAPDPTYVPTDFALEFVTFIKLVNGSGGEEHKTPLMHYKMLDTIVSGDRDLANLCFRGSAKTTLFGEYLFLYLAVYGKLPGFGKINLAIYVSDSIDNGVKNMRKNLEFRWEESEFLQKYVPTTRFTDIRYEFTNIEGNKFLVKGYGAKTGVRGAKELAVRPQLAVLDDLISDEDARSPTIIASVEDTVDKAIEHALHPQRRMVIWSGTPFNAKDPLYKAVESGAYKVNVFPVCERFPCSETEFQGAWADRFGYKEVLRSYVKAKKKGKISGFDQELMLRIMSDDDRLIEDQDMRWYKIKNVLDYRGRFNFYITTDFATSERQAADYSVISVWAVNNAGDWFWVDGICQRQTMDKNINDLFRLAQKHNPLSVGIEVSGQQGGFIPWIQEQMMTRNIYFHLASGNNNDKPGLRPSNTTNKLERFNIVVPWFKQGKMYFPDEKKLDPALVEMVDELELASQGGFRSKKDDSIDTISQLPELNAWYPSEIGTVEQRDDGMWELDEVDNASSPLESYIV